MIMKTKVKKGTPLRNSTGKGIGANKGRGGCAKRFSFALPTGRNATNRRK